MQVLSQKKSGIVEIELNSPETLNAIGVSISTELSLAVQKAISDDEIDLIVIKAFGIDKVSKKPIAIAGGNLKELSTLTSQEALLYAQQMSQVIHSLVLSSKPSVFLAHGALIGGGAELALACDLRYATKDSDLIFKQMHIGLATGYGTAKRMRDLLGLGICQRLLFADPKLDAEEALQRGIWHGLFQSPEDLNNQVSSIATKAKSYGKEAWQAQKKMWNENLSIAEENQIFADIWKNPTHQARLDAFLTPK